MYHIGGTAINTNTSMVLWSCSSSALNVESRSSSKQGLVCNKTLRFLSSNCVVKMYLMTMYSSDTAIGRVVGCCDHGDEQFGSVKGGSFCTVSFSSWTLLRARYMKWQCDYYGEGERVGKQAILPSLNIFFFSAAASLLGPKQPHCWDL